MTLPKYRIEVLMPNPEIAKQVLKQVNTGTLVSYYNSTYVRWEFDDEYFALERLKWANILIENAKTILKYETD